MTSTFLYGTFRTNEHVCLDMDRFCSFDNWLCDLISENWQLMLCLFPSYLNHAFVYFNVISATIYVMYLLRFKLQHALTTKHTLHSRVKLSITQNLDCCFSKVCRITV